MISIRETEHLRTELQRQLDEARSRDERNRLGQFATPLQLASDILAHALSLLPPALKVRFLEPGFGTGTFYSALLHHVPTDRIQSAVGYEIDPFYARPSNDLWKTTGLQLNIADFTTTRPPGPEPEKYNLVVCNPPYVRHHHLSQQQKHELQAAVARYLNFEMNGLSGLYAYFMLLSQAWMQSGGVGAWLIPSEFMDVNYGRKVKKFLLERVTLRRVHRFDPNEVQFGDALVSSAVVFFTNSPPHSKQEVEFSYGGTLLDARITDEITPDDLRQTHKWTALPRSPSRRVTRSVQKTLADLFIIKRGVATGCNSFFILPPQAATQLNLPEECLLPILPSPRDLGTEEIFADHNGEPIIENRRYLLACRLAEDEVRAEHPSLWFYLQRGIEQGVKERYLSLHRQPWYTQEIRPPAPLLCTYMGRPSKRSKSPFRFIINHSRAIAPNVYLMLYPKPELAALLNSDQNLLREVWQALTSITADMLTGEGRIYGGGLHKMEPRELANVPAKSVLEVLPSNGDVLQSQLQLVLP